MENQTKINKSIINEETEYQPQSENIPCIRWSILFYVFAISILVVGFVIGGIIADSTPTINGIEIETAFNWKLALIIWGGTLLTTFFYLPVPIILHRQEKIINKLNEL